MTSLTWPQVLAWRMRRQFLDEPGRGAVEIARRLCGVQAQVASSAELAIAVRLGKPPAFDGPLLEERSLVKTWLMRGTLHLLPADDLPAYCSALGALRFWEKGSWQRGHGVTAAETAAIMETAPEVLKGRVLTREELVAAIVAATGDVHLAEALQSGWGALLKPLALTGRLCYGPPRDGRVTFTRPDVWLSTWREVPPAEEGGIDVVRAFLGAHGPASPEMFDGWLSRGKSRRALLKGWFRDLEAELATVSVEGTQLSVLARDLDDLAATKPTDSVRLLPGFDAYVLGAPRDLEALLPAAHRAKVSRTAGWISPVVVYGGRIAGVWAANEEVELFERVPADRLAAERERVGALLAKA